MITDVRRDKHPPFRTSPHVVRWLSRKEMNGGKTKNASQALTRVQVPPKGGFFLNPRLLLVPVDHLLVPFAVLLQFPGRPWSGVRRGLKCWKFSLVYVLPFAHRPRLTGSASLLYALRLAVSCIANNKNTERLSKFHALPDSPECTGTRTTPLHPEPCRRNLGTPTLRCRFESARQTARPLGRTNFASLSHRQQLVLLAVKLPSVGHPQILRRRGRQRQDSKSPRLKRSVLKHEDSTSVSTRGRRLLPLLCLRHVFFRTINGPLSCSAFAAPRATPGVRVSAAL